jgi:hypothetical protein
MMYSRLYTLLLTLPQPQAFQVSRVGRGGEIRLAKVDRIRLIVIEAPL